MVTQCATSLVLFGTGDVLAQQAFEKKGSNHDVRYPFLSLDYRTTPFALCSGFALRGCRSTEVRLCCVYPASAVTPRLMRSPARRRHLWPSLDKMAATPQPPAVLLSYKGRCVQSQFPLFPGKFMSLSPLVLSQVYLDQFVFTPGLSVFSPTRCSTLTRASFSRRDRALLWRQHSSGGQERR